MTQHAKQRAHFLPFFHYIITSDTYGPCGRPGQSRENSQERCLASTIRSKDTQTTSMLEFEINASKSCYSTKMFMTPLRYTIVSVLTLLFSASLSPFDLLHFFAVPRSAYKAAPYRPDDAGDTCHHQLCHARTRHPTEQYSAINIFLLP